ncbi:hypothetical protein ACWGA9_24775 [Streptomyces sp. NPDC054950]
MSTVEAKTKGPPVYLHSTFDGPVRSAFLRQNWTQVDATQGTPPKSPGSEAILVTAIGLGSMNGGFAASIFGRLVGDQTLYEATTTGAGTSVGGFLLGLAIASFIRKGGEG